MFFYDVHTTNVFIFIKNMTFILYLNIYYKLWTNNCYNDFVVFLILQYHLLSIEHTTFHLVKSRMFNKKKVIQTNNVSWLTPKDRLILSGSTFTSMALYIIDFILPWHLHFVDHIYRFSTDNFTVRKYYCAIYNI